MQDLPAYIAAYIQEELARGKTTEDIDRQMVADAIEAYEGGAR
jgi:hypothetical protein